MLELIQEKQLPQGLNDTTLVLIPKKHSPDKMANLRPIALCSIVYKVMAKMLANRLKSILPEIVSKNQNAFVTGQHITDTVVIAYEMTHYLKRQRKAKVGSATFKLDISKA